VIGTLKVGYKRTMLMQLLSVFDQPNGFELAEQACK
jgi:hypothetical protein